MKKWIIWLIIVLLVGGTILLWILISKSGNNSISQISSGTVQTSTPIITSSTSPSPSSTGSQANVWGEYVINEPNALILVDPQGRRTGKDPITGTTYREIPGTSYSDEATTPGHSAGQLFISNLPNGQYTLYVLGGQTGSYSLDIANNKGQQTFQGTIQKGSMIAYTQNYDSTNLASSTFSFSSATSSTASITTAPPDNLPPPPIP